MQKQNIDDNDSSNGNNTAAKTVLSFLSGGVVGVTAFTIYNKVTKTTESESTQKRDNNETKRPTQGRK